MKKGRKKTQISIKKARNVTKCDAINSYLHNAGDLPNILHAGGRQHFSSKCGSLPQIAGDLTGLFKTKAPTPCGYHPAMLI